MPLNPAIDTRVSITSIGLSGDSVAKAFNTVLAMNFDYAKGMVNIVDSRQGSFYFPLIPVTTITITIAGTTTVVTIT